MSSVCVYSSVGVFVLVIKFNTILYNIHVGSSTRSVTFCTHNIYSPWFSCTIQGAGTAEVAPQLGNRSSSLSPSLGIHRGWSGNVLLISTRFRSVVFLVEKKFNSICFPRVVPVCG